MIQRIPQVSSIDNRSGASRDSIIGGHPIIINEMTLRSYNMDPEYWLLLDERISLGNSKNI
jgi:hypothetical protein